MTVIIMRKTLLLLAVVLSGSVYMASGQSTCTQTLRLAQSVYEQGRLHELPQLLDGCLKNQGFNNAEKVNAYKLLTLTYIYLEEPAKADEAMLELLRTETEFKVNDAVDPAEFVALYKTFRTTPVFRVGGKMGAVASEPSIISADFVDDGTNIYTYNIGFNVTVAGEIPLTNSFKKFTLNPELSFQLLSFKGSNLNADSARVTKGTETQAWISLPLSLQYKVYEKGGTNFFVAGGLSADYLLSSTNRIISQRKGNSPVEENSFDVVAQRNHFNMGLLFSTGFKRKIGKGYLIAEVRYKIGLIPMLTRADTYENSMLVFDYKYVDGIFKLNTLSLSIGYIINRYNPKKLTSK